MVVNMESRSPKVDAALLSVAVVLFAFGIAGQYLFSAQSLLLRLAGLAVTLSIAVLIVSRTLVARRFWAFWQDSIVELRKVVWPTKQETVHSTVAVLAMVFIMGLVLWSIDAVLVRLMAWIIKQGAV